MSTFNWINWLRKNGIIFFRNESESVPLFLYGVFDTILTDLKSSKKLRDEELELYPNRKDLQESDGFAGITCFLALKNVNCIIIELEYIDLDYWDDFGRCLVKEYYHVSKNCIRLSFFSFPVDILSEIDPECIFDDGKIGTTFQAGFLGFTIIRPLPVGFVGRTRLVPLSKSDYLHLDLSTLESIVPPFSPDILSEFQEKAAYCSDNATLTTLVKHKINLYGLELELNSSLYIARCPAAGVCASNSVYIALKLVNKFFESSYPASISKITYLARNQEIHNPSQFQDQGQGLTIREMQNAFEKLNLRTHNWTLKPESIDDCHLKTLIVPYLNSKIPVIMTFSFVRQVHEHGQKEILAYHALTAIGYHSSERFDASIVENGYLAETTDALIVQDDIRIPEGVLIFSKNSRSFQFPPALKNSSIKKYGDKMKIGDIITSFEYDYSWDLLGILVPVSDLIRLSARDVIDILDLVKNEFYVYTRKLLIWHIELLEIHDFRKKIMDQLNKASDDLEIEKFSKLLGCPGPKYIWNCVAFTKSGEQESYNFDDFKTIMALQIDASGIAHPISIRRILAYSELYAIFDDNEKIKGFFASVGARDCTVF